MRALSRFMLVVMVALLVALAIFFVHPEAWSPQQWFSQGASGSPSGAGQSGSAHQLEQPRQGKVSEKSKLDLMPGIAATGAPEPTSARPSRSGNPHRFPQADQVFAGTTTAVVLETFGPPTATVTKSNSGQLEERFVYLDKVSGTRTHVVFMNGRVIGANTFKE